VLKLLHFMKKETSGLAFTTLELVVAEEKAGHKVCLREPTGGIIYGTDDGDHDVELIHSQLPITSYHNGKPRFLWCHGEPLSSVGNGVSMKAILDLASRCDAFIAMRQEEMAYWSLIKRTYLVPKGIDLDTFKPLSMGECGAKLSGAPSVLYYENWRGQRNPLPLIVAMQQVWQKYPEARLHLWNCNDKRMHECFKSLIHEAKLETYVRSLQGPVAPKEVNGLLNRVDIVASCLHPLYARSIEAFGAGKPLVCPGYRDLEYPYRCELDPDDMARAIIKAWEGRNEFPARAWAERHHDVRETVKQSLAIYQRYL